MNRRRMGWFGAVAAASGCGATNSLTPMAGQSDTFDPRGAFDATRRCLTAHATCSSAMAGSPRSYLPGDVHEAVREIYGGGKTLVPA
jgi:hypothetical protein